MSKSLELGPNWNLADEYPSFNSEELTKDLDEVAILLCELEERGKAISTFVERASIVTRNEAQTVAALIATASHLYERTAILIGNISAFATCVSSTDGTSEDARKLKGQAVQLWSRMLAGWKPAELFMSLTNQEGLNQVQSLPPLEPHKFYIEQLRKIADDKLSLPEENMIVALASDGISAWSELYNTLAGSLSCKLTESDGSQLTSGIAATGQMLFDPDTKVRKSAFVAINEAWKPHLETCARSLNSIAGTRIELARRRSIKRQVHVLDQSLHTSRIKKTTLTTMMEVVRARRSLAQECLSLQAEILGLVQLGPWDLVAPSPTAEGGVSSAIPFATACKWIVAAFSQISPEMGEFAAEVISKKWIDGGAGPHRRPGAYCIRFPKSKSPRVYLTYSGSMRDVVTLAHELGHAYHAEVMKDLPWVQRFYPMTLAETASVLAENVVTNYCIENAANFSQAIPFHWDLFRTAETFLLNVPARFTFEVEFYERRRRGLLSPREISELMTTHWKDWYGETLSEMSTLFWCWKGHFYKSDRSFYNYPYTFGLLFTLGILSERPRLGDDFFAAYKGLLLDTGRMNVEELAAKHLAVDLGAPEFWENSISIIARRVAAFRRCWLVRENANQDLSLKV
jgi:oligoendopeptidase F